MVEDDFPFHPEARIELIHAILVHEHARRGYGAKLEAEIAEVIRQVLSFADSGVRVHGYPPELEVRGFLLRRFTYTVFVRTSTASR